MPIRPIDMQVAIPKLSEVSRMSHLEQQKAGLQQNQNAVSHEKGVRQENQSVNQTNRDEQAGSEADAREEGRNLYQRPSSKKTKNHQKDQKEPSDDGTYHKIDIRI